MEKRFRIMARIPDGQGEPRDVIKAKTVSNKLYTCSDPTEQWWDDNVPCQKACPANTRVPEYIDAVARGDHDKAYQINRQDNVLPHILGRVCSHPCEDACRHGNSGMGDAVSICWLKRCGADHKENSPTLVAAEATGKNIAIIGSGPAGLAAAQDLTLLGHSVTIHEGMEKAGGMLRYGIPQFRLPEELIDDEIQQVLDTGIKLKTESWIDAEGLKKLAEENHAVIMAAGSMVPQKMNIAGEELERVISGLDFMAEVDKGKITKVFGHVMVLGGGFTAMDCARSALRLGAEKVSIVYRRRRNDLRVDNRELTETSIEGVEFLYLLSPIEVKAGNAGAVKEVVLQRQSVGEVGTDGKCKITPIDGQNITIEVDWLIPAISQSPNTAPFGKDFSIDDNSQTNIPKVFATGDYATGPKDIISAIGAAHKTSKSVDKFLMGEDRFTTDIKMESWQQKMPNSYKGWKSIDGNVFDLIPKKDMPSLPLAERKGQNTEVDTGYSKEDGYWQGERCYLCNHNIMIDEKSCILCYNCVDVCPYNCIQMLMEENVRVAKGGEAVAENSKDVYMIMEETNCVRCGLCMDVCPIPCITMEKRAASTGLPTS